MSDTKRLWRVLLATALISPPTWAQSLVQEGAQDAGFGAPVAEIELATERGRELMLEQNNKILTDGELYDNRAVDNVTGMNTITEGAFAAASGLPTVIQNSGNNVLIQNATILNLTVQ